MLPQVPNLQTCGAGGTALFDLTQQNALLLTGQPGATVTYYTSAQDAAAGINAITTPAAFANTVNPQTIFAVVSNGTCNAITQFNVLAVPAPQLPQLPQLSLCATTPGNAQTSFNLTQQEALITPGTEIHYFTTPEDASANTNAITTPASFENTINPQTIYVRGGSGNCFAVTQFVISVLPAPNPDVENQLTGCPPFNLADAVGTNQQGLQFSYYTSEADADAGTNAIADSQNFTFIGQQAIVYIRAENEADCTFVLPIGLVSEGCDVPKGVSPNGDEKNDTFDLAFLNVNRLSIFNRYGMQVYSCTNYTNQWHGQTDNQQELPSGVYYYVIEPANGAYKTGWVYVNQAVN